MTIIKPPGGYFVSDEFGGKVLVGYASANVSRISKGGTAIYKRVPGNFGSPKEAVAEYMRLRKLGYSPRDIQSGKASSIENQQYDLKTDAIAVDTKAVKEFNVLMKERGVTAGTYLSALKGDQGGIMKVTGQAQAQQKFDTARESSKTSCERAIEKQQSRDIKAYEKREGVKSYMTHKLGIKRTTWLSKFGTEALMLPYDFTAGFTAPASAGEKVYLAGRGLFEKDVGVKSVGKGFVQAGKDTPKALAETFDVRKPEGALAVATVVGFTVLGGKMIKVARAKGVVAGVKSKGVKVKPHKVGKGFKIKFKIKQTPKAVEKGLKIGISKKGIKINKVADMVTRGKGVKTTLRYQTQWKKVGDFQIGKRVIIKRITKYSGRKGFLQRLEKIGLRKPKVDKVVRTGRVIKSRSVRLENRGGVLKPKSSAKRFRQTLKERLATHKASSTEANIIKQRALAQAKKPFKPFDSKSVRKSQRVQYRLKAGQRSGYQLGKEKYFYKVSKSQVKPVKKSSVLKNMFKSKKGQTQLVKTKLLTKPGFRGVSVLKPIIKPSLYIPPITLLGGSIIKPRSGKGAVIPKSRTKSLILPRFNVAPLPKFKLDVSPKVIQIPKITQDQIPAVSLTGSGLSYALGLGAVGVGAFAFKNILQNRLKPFNFDWPGGGGGSGGRLFGWRYGLKIHKFDTKKLIGV